MTLPNEAIAYWPTTASIAGAPTTMFTSTTTTQFPSYQQIIFPQPPPYGNNPYNPPPHPNQQFYLHEHQYSQATDEFQPPSNKKLRLPMELTVAAAAAEPQTIIVRRQCISKKNAKRLKRLKHLRNFFTSSYQRSLIDPSNWCFYFWLEALREIKLSQSGFERVTSKLRHLSMFMSEAIQQLSASYELDVYMLLAAVISIPFVAETELSVERAFVTFCDLIEDILKINGILESELNDHANDLKHHNLKPKKARLSVLVTALFNLISTQQQQIPPQPHTTTASNSHRPFLYPYGYV